MPRTALSPRLCLALTIGPVPGRDDDLSDALLREAWIEHRARLRATAPLDREPWAFWRFDEAVPDSLRGQHPQLVEVDADEPVPVPESAEDLDFRRAAWLDERNGARSATNA